MTERKLPRRKAKTKDQRLMRYQPPASKTCRRKKPYQSKNAARDAARKASKLSGQHIEHYFCYGCDCWHIGHPHPGANRHSNPKHA